MRTPPPTPSEVTELHHYAFCKWEGRSIRYTCTCGGSAVGIVSWDEHLTQTTA